VNDSFTTDSVLYHEVLNITQVEYNLRKKELYYYNEENNTYINCEQYEAISVGKEEFELSPTKYYYKNNNVYINCLNITWDTIQEEQLQLFIEINNWIEGRSYFYKEIKELIYGTLKYDKTAIRTQMTEENNLYASPYFLYKIGTYFAPSKLNNYIQCIVEKNGVSYRTAKDLTFGQAGSAGTEYTFVLELEKNVNALTAGKE
jgi:hypothetical protein